MALSKILTRSPYFVEVTGALNDEIKVELFLYNDPSSVPIAPTKTLSKTIFTGTTVSFNVSPYAREYIDITPTCLVASIYPSMNRKHYGRLKYKTYINGTLTTTVSNIYCFDGYGYFEEGYNFISSDFFLDEGTYYYYSGAVGYEGTLSLGAGANWYVKYTETTTLVTNIISLGSTAGVKTINRVEFPTLGNKVEIFTSTHVLQATYYFLPQDECAYAPVGIDFINKYGVSQREVFWKASYQSFEVNSTPFKAMPSGIDYDTSRAINQIMNVNGKQTLKVNTGWVSESYSSTLQELMLSEQISVDINMDSNLIPVKLKTNSIELHKHINKKLINYTLEFEYAFDKLNNVI